MMTTAAFVETDGPLTPHQGTIHNEGEGIGKKAHYITHEVWDWDTGKGEGDHKLLKRAMFQPDLGR